MGIYMVNHEILTFLPPAGPYGFDNLMLDLLKGGKPVNVKTFDGYWMDIGRPDDYIQAIEVFESMKDRFFHE